jgi:tRNA threonylcarbamoyladenosine biosynthesis protein TsaE
MISVDKQRSKKHSAEQMLSHQIFIKDEAGMLALGAKLANLLPKEFNLYLSGELGAGKTTLVRGFLRALQYQGAVKSPTYTLVESYKLQARQVYHFDFYRLISPEELEFMGIRDYFSHEAIRLVEWPERAGNLLPPPDWHVTLATESLGRRIDIIARGLKGCALLSQWIK